MSNADQAGQALRDYINAQSYSEPLTASVNYYPRHEIESVQSLSLLIDPTGTEREKRTRGPIPREYTIWLYLCDSVFDEATNSIDQTRFAELIALVEEICRSLEARGLLLDLGGGVNAALVGAVRVPVLYDDQAAQRFVFCSELELTLTAGE